jgi:hypothetical protein
LVTIAAWNIKGLHPIPTARLEKSSGVIRRIKPHLILLIEVDPEDVASHCIKASVSWPTIRGNARSSPEFDRDSTYLDPSPTQRRGFECAVD